MGNVSFELEGRRMSCEDVTVISSMIERMVDFHCDIDFVLVVEKESIFHRLAASKFPFRTRCFMLTGKGYPGAHGTARLLITGSFHQKQATDTSAPVLFKG